MISFAQPLPIGNAVKIVLQPPRTAERWLVMRKLTNDITGPDDEGAIQVFQGCENLVVDTCQLQNGQTYYYAEFDTVDGVNWTQGGASVAVTVTADEVALAVDVQDILRRRLEAGLAVFVGSGKPLNPASGKVPVYTAPPAFDEIKWPIVSVHVDNDASEIRGIGEMVVPDYIGPGDAPWVESEGWLSRWRLQVICWSQNSDERIALRKVVKAIIIGNLEVFDAAGMVQVDFSQSDVDDFQTYNVPVYESVGVFSCLAPSLLQDDQDSVSDVTVDGEAC